MSNGIFNNYSLVSGQFYSLFYFYKGYDADSKVVIISQIHNSMSWCLKKKDETENHVTELKLVYKLQCLEKQLHRIIICVEQKIMSLKYNSANVLTPERQMRTHANQFLFCTVTLEWD